eukprot:TRINITY_DN16723_c1_g1_i1.p1 TRINITY_DN16723_c1_g1~~TRINITY_DN16723_c1_g1_i1.p1  ORF type:complete len:353 (+),score=61.19 TRINITY_DN16723_c1_g1_i1:88-1146(+)
MLAAGAMADHVTEFENMIPGDTEPSMQLREQHQRTCRLITWQFVENSPSAPETQRKASLLYHVSTSCIIIITVVKETTATTGDNWLRKLALVVLLIEYVLRLYSCVEDENDDCARPCVRRLRYACKGTMIADMLASTGLLLDILTGDQQITWISWLRMLRLCRLIHLESSLHFLKPVRKVLVLKRYDLLATFGGALLLLLIVSAAMFYIECDANTKFSSVTNSMWWGTAALTTVGYGDIVPITPAGKILGSIVAFAGVGIFGLPAAVLAAGFEEQRRSEKRRPVEALETNPADQSLASEIANETVAAELAAVAKGLNALQTDVSAQFKSLSSDIAALKKQHVEILAILKRKS